MCACVCACVSFCTPTLFHQEGKLEVSTFRCALLASARLRGRGLFVTHGVCVSMRGRVKIEFGFPVGFHVNRLKMGLKEAHTHVSQKNQLVNRDIGGDVIYLF